MIENKNTQEPEEINVNITDINIKRLIPNMIDDFIVTVYEDHHTIFMPMNSTGTNFKIWKKGKGGVFSKDVLNFSLDKSHGNYVMIKGAGINCIARLIDEDEEIFFKTNKLIDGQIKDKSFMIFKDLNIDNRINTTNEYINERDVEPDENLYIPNVIKKTTNDEDDFEHHKGSISLFS
jgi:hypothetical protein